MKSEIFDFFANATFQELEKVLEKINECEPNNELIEIEQAIVGLINS